MVLIYFFGVKYLFSSLFLFLYCKVVSRRSDIAMIFSSCLWVHIFSSFTQITYIMQMKSFDKRFLTTYIAFLFIIFSQIFLFFNSFIKSQIIILSSQICICICICIWNVIFFLIVIHIVRIRIA